MSMVSRRMRPARFLLTMAFVLAAMTLTTGVVAAAPPSAFSVNPTSVSFGSVLVNSSASTTVTVTTGHKALVLQVETDNGQYSDAATGSCAATYGYEVPAYTSCTIDVIFAPLVAHDFPAALTVSSCMKWHLANGLPFCDRVKDSTAISLDGSGQNLP